MSQPIQANNDVAASAKPIAAQPDSKIKRLLRRMMMLVVIVYLVFLTVLYCFQRSLVFPGTWVPTAMARFDPPQGTTPITLHTADGTLISGLFCRAFEPTMVPTNRPADFPTIIYFYGNAQVVAHALYEVDIFRRCGANVLLADYPGYGLSAGKASEQGCYQTADALWKYAAESPEVDPGRIISAGWSLGGAVAIDMARRRPVAGLMTASTFTALNDVAQRQVWFVPTGIILSSEFRSIDKIPSIHCPTLIIHGDADKLVPYSMSLRLVAASPAAWVRHIPIAGSGHNEVFAIGYGEISAGLKDFLRVVGKAPMAVPLPAVSR